MLTVFLALPWLGYELRARARARAARCAGAHARRHRAGGRHRAARPAAALRGGRRSDCVVRPRARPNPRDADASLPPSASPEIAQIIEGLSRTTARIWVIDRAGHRARARRYAASRAPRPALPASRVGAHRAGHRSARSTRRSWSSRARTSPTTPPRRARRAAATWKARSRGILTTRAAADVRRPRVDRERRASRVGRRPGARRGDRRGDRQRRARGAQPRLRAPVQHRAGRAARRLARAHRVRHACCPRASVACATTPSARSMPKAACARRWRARSAGDEIGDLSRSFASVLAPLVRLCELPGEDGEPALARAAHADRGGAQLARQPQGHARCRDESRVYMERAQEGLARLTQILTRMTEAARLEQSLSDVERERFDLVAVVTGCVEGYRARVSRRAHRAAAAAGARRDRRRARPDRADARQARRQRRRVRRAAADRSRAAPPRRRASCCASANDGPLLPEGMEGRLFESMVSVRAGGDAARAAPRAGPVHRAPHRAVPSGHGACAPTCPMSAAWRSM